MSPFIHREPPRSHHNLQPRIWIFPRSHGMRPAPQDELWMSMRSNLEDSSFLPRQAKLGAPAQSPIYQIRLDPRATFLPLTPPRHSLPILSNLSLRRLRAHLSGGRIQLHSTIRQMLAPIFHLPQLHPRRRQRLPESLLRLLLLLRVNLPTRWMTSPFPRLKSMPAGRFLL